MSKPPRKYSTHPPLPPSLSSLPEEIVLRCLALVPRSYHLSLSWISKNLRSLVRSPELNALRSIRHKSSLYVCFRNKSNDPNWFTLRPTEETAAAATEYRLAPNPTPFPPHNNYGSSTVVVGPKIFFIGGSREPSPDQWILDTLKDTAYLVCVVEDVLFALFNWSGIMWFDTKRNVWRRLLGHDGKQLLFILHADAMAEYDDGLYMLSVKEVDDTVSVYVGLAA